MLFWWCEFVLVCVEVDLVCIEVVLVSAGSGVDIPKRSFWFGVVDGSGWRWCVEVIVEYEDDSVEEWM